MSTRLISLVSFVLTLGLVLTNMANAAEKTHLIGWWMFDGETLDYSGLGNDGTAVGNPTFATGKIGSNALDLDGDDYVTIDGVADDITGSDITLTAWIKTIDNDADWFSCNTETGNVVRFCIEGGKAAFDTDREHALSTTTVSDDLWHLLTFVRSGSTGYVYVDGVQENSYVAAFNFSPTDRWSIGQEWDIDIPSGFLTGTLDDVRMYDRTLSAALVQDLFNGITPAFVKAEDPEPADDELFLDTWVILSWSPGDTAASHDVYLGDIFNEVNDGTGETFRDNLASPLFVAGYPGLPYPDGLAPDTTYYWRIDEVEADGNTIHKGDVWTFTTPPAKAYKPEPADSARFVDPNVTFSWTTGFDAKLHAIHFGDNFDDVNNAAGGLPQVATTLTPGALDLDKIYYWRVDEFDGSATRKGDIWSFRTRPFIPIADPNLVGWWKLDGQEFGTAVDYSGYDHHGTLRGDPQWVAGYDGSALEFDGSGDYVTIDGYKGILAANGVQHEFTVAAWVKTTADGEIITWGTNAGTQRMSVRVHGGRIRVEHGGGNMRGETSVNDNEWHHVAAVIPHDGAVKDLTFYLDGEVDEYRTILNPDIKFNLRGTADVSIGRRADNNSGHFKGLIDDARIYDKALAQEEVQLAVRIDPLLAWDPSPANRSTPHVGVAAPLSWAPGDEVVQHYVYFGANEEEVTNADTSDTTGVYRGRQSATSYTPPETLEFTRRYYWRIDQFNGNRTISRGRVWSFTVANFLLVDDFEGYNDYEPNRIFDKWLDGWGIPTNGSIVGYPRPNFVEGEHYVETEIVRSGSQSMPFFYDNHFKYSEATMTLSHSRDWTERNVNTLTLWFRGDPANAPARMYVVLNGTAVVYNNSRGPTRINVWTRWNIDLTQFAGVDLTDVNTITIGIGDKHNPQAGGSGVVYFDDVRLYR